jgi:hypothetical protein
LLAFSIGKNIKIVFEQDLAEDGVFAHTVLKCSGSLWRLGLVWRRKATHVTLGMTQEQKFKVMLKLCDQDQGRACPPSLRIYETRMIGGDDKPFSIQIVYRQLLRPDLIPLYVVRRGVLILGPVDL